jgi:benzoate membrane transport protein
MLLDRHEERSASPMTTLEPPERPLPAWRDIIRSLDRHVATNAVVAWLFAITGPLAILLAVATKADFGQDQVAAWIFGAHAIPGFLSILTSYLYRQPSGIAWSIPGAILIGPGWVILALQRWLGPASRRVS